MSPRRSVSPVGERVFNLLQSHRDELGADYVRILHERVGPHYGTRPTEELSGTTESSVAAYLAVLGAGDWGPMNAFIQEIADKRFPLRFPLSEVQRAFAVFREIAHPLITASFRGPELDAALRLLDDSVDETINRFSDTYQNLHLEEIRRTSDELAEAHRQLRSQYEEVAEAARFKSQFFANMSHELRSPLNSIIGYTELLLDGVDGSVNDEQGGDLKRILAASRYLLKLINNILDMTRIEAGRMGLDIQPFDARGLVGEVLDTVTPLAYRKKIQLRAEVAEGLVTFISDRDKLQQVLINLLANAVKFTDEGEVVCSARKESDRLVVEVRDTGIGISAEDQKRVFTKFYQADPSHSREHRGTGLGLPLCRMLVELLGGEIRVESRVGEGSRFSFWVPEAELPSVASTRGERVEGRPLVLVVEDDPSALELIQKVLESAGMETLPARDGEEGLRLARERRPAAITLDLLMPRVHGWDVLAQLKTDPSTRGIPVAIVSCLDRPAKGLQAGADAFLTKPLERTELVRTLRRLVVPEGARKGAGGPP